MSPNSPVLPRRILAQISCGTEFGFEKAQPQSRRTVECQPTVVDHFRKAIAEGTFVPISPNPKLLFGDTGDFNRFYAEHVLAERRDKAEREASPNPWLFLSDVVPPSPSPSSSCPPQESCARHPFEPQTSRPSSCSPTPAISVHSASLTPKPPAARGRKTRGHGVSAVGDGGGGVRRSLRSRRGAVVT